jgi:hypothetical protein
VLKELAQPLRFVELQSISIVDGMGFVLVLVVGIL